MIKHLLPVPLILITAGCSDDPSGSAADLGAPPADISHDSALTDTGADQSTSAEVVKTGGGTLTGKVQGKVRSFLGIPYAAPPLGALRFTAPKPNPGWTGSRAATSFGPGCPQVVGEMGKALPSGKPQPFTANEDCLTINVWTPWPLPAKSAPVLVWIHGGGYTSGASSVAHIAPAGAAMAEKHGLVVVSFNYRIGPLGFLAHAALGKGSGNFGIQDQQAALKWVQLNISAFGGDPKNITLAGESAGASSVCVHLTSAGSKWLFHRAVMESGACPQKFPQNSAVKPRAEAEAQGAKLVTAVGCTGTSDVMACLRNKTVAQLLKALPISEDFTGGSGGVTWGPNVDGVTLTKQPLDLVRAGAFHKVPVLMGTNKDEGTVLVMAAKKEKISKVEYTAVVNKMFSLGAFMVLGSYPSLSYNSGGLALADLMGDLVFTCPARRTARALAAAGVKTYLYRFAAVPAYNTSSFLGAYHSAEVPFVFGTPPPSYAFTIAEAALSQKMMAYWAAFARDGAPNSGAATAWPSFGKASDKHLVLGDKVAASPGLKRTKCDFWDKLSP